MWREIWIGFGIIIWIFGFLRTGYRKKVGMPIEKSFVRPPFFIYLICGMPKARNVPSGIMAVSALMAQLNGLFWIVYGLIYPCLPSRTIIHQLILLNLGMILIFIFGWILYKRNPYEVD